MSSSPMAPPFPARCSVPPPRISAFALIGPVIFFLSMGSVMRRAQEMRHTARSMAEVAIRLAEPETIATEQVVTLSQAIRREVASMGDGIERALARASELETMVRAEVSSLERTYGENERRIRLLLNELASERESIVVNADRVSTALSDAQYRGFASELEAATRAIDRPARPDRRPHRALARGQGRRHRAGLRQVRRRLMLNSSKTRAATLLDRFEPAPARKRRAPSTSARRQDRWRSARPSPTPSCEKVKPRTDCLSQTLDEVGARLGETIGRRAERLDRPARGPGRPPA